MAFKMKGSPFLQNGESKKTKEQCEKPSATSSRGERWVDMPNMKEAYLKRVASYEACLKRNS